MSHETDVAVIDRHEHQSVAVRDRGFLSSQDVLARTTRILEIMKAVMKEGIHFGKIPGTPKPTLYKPGAEKLLVTFQIAGIPIQIEDLSTADEIRYRVRVQGVSQVTGTVLGEAVGECSSNEEKYRWRKPVCDQEYDETPEDMRRAVWKRGGEGKPYKAKQIRTSPADVANTILQMATKRGLIPMTRVVLACSDTFDQDLEDMPVEIRESLVELVPAPLQAPQRKGDAPAAAPVTAAEPEASAPTDAAPAASSAPASSFNGPNSGVISEKQAKRFYAIAMGAGWTQDGLKAYLKKAIGTEDDRQIPRRQYDDFCAAVGAGPR